MRVYGLVSEEGRKLNGRLGTVTVYQETTGRCGVLIEGTETPKSILPMNLNFLGLEDDYIGP